MSNTLLPVEDLMRLGEMLKQKNVWNERNTIVTLCTNISSHLERCVLAPQDAPDRMKQEVAYLNRLQDMIEETLYYGIQTKINSIYD